MFRDLGFLYAREHEGGHLPTAVSDAEARGGASVLARMVPRGAHGARVVRRELGGERRRREVVEREVFVGRHARIVSRTCDAIAFMKSGATEFPMRAWIVCRSPIQRKSGGKLASAASSEPESARGL